MKSIKEKAEEVFPIEEHASLETKLQRRKMRMCYEHGANYVLGEILDKTSKCITIKDAYETFLECVKQLKK